MQAYLNDTKLKERFIKEITKHEKADQIIQGTYGIKNGKWKGCAVSCSLRSLAILKNEELKITYRDHVRYEDLIGVPQVLARLEDRIFEGLPVKEAKTWPRRFAESVPVGADLSKVWPKFAVWMLIDKKDGVIRFANGKQHVIDSITRVAFLYQETINGVTIESKTWKTASAAAAAADADAYADAAYAYAYAAPAYAAADAAYAAAAYAASTASASASASAYAASASDAYASASAYAYANTKKITRQKIFLRMSEKLIELLQEA